MRSPEWDRIHSRPQYRQVPDTGKRPATGRDGSATLTTRALFNSDRTTTLEITTGALDGSTTPGNLNKVQLKTMDPNGSLLSTTNYVKLKNGGSV